MGVSAGRGRYRRCGFGVPALPVACQLGRGPREPSAGGLPPYHLYRLSLGRLRKMRSVTSRPQPTFFRTSSDEAGEGGKRGNQPFRFAPNSRRSQSIFRFPKAALHSAVSNYTSGYNAEIADLDLLSASSSHKLLYLSRCSWDARAKVLGSRRGNQIHVFDPDAVIL